MTDKLPEINQTETDDIILTHVRAEQDRRGITQAQVAKEAGVSPATLTQLFNGTYNANPKVQLAKLEKWLAAAAEAQAQPKMLPLPEWTETPTANRVMAALGYAQMAGDVALIYGGAGLGKTTATKEYRRRYPNVWIATMTPATSSVATCLEKVCFALGMKNPPQGSARMEREILSRIANTGGLLLIDEAQHLSVQALDALRSLHDATGMGLALVGNEAVYTSMTGGNRAAYLDRLYSRIGKRVKLTRAKREDVINLSAVLGVNPNDSQAIKLLTDIGSRSGALRSVVKTVRLAAMFAGGEAVEYKHIKAAWGDLSNA